MSAIHTLKEGTPLVHITRSKDFQLDPAKAIWLSEAGPEGLGIQYMGGTKKVRFRPVRDLDMFVFHESGLALQSDIRDAIGVVQEAVHGGNLGLSALDEVKSALKNALNSDGTKWKSNSADDRALVDALAPSFGFLGIDGWMRDFGNNREFLILQPGMNLIQALPKPPPNMTRGDAWEEGQNRRY
jgi:hypothetical protein